MNPQAQKAIEELRIEAEANEQANKDRNAAEEDERLARINIARSEPFAYIRQKIVAMKDERMGIALTEDSELKRVRAQGGHAALDELLIFFESAQKEGQRG